MDFESLIQERYSCKKFNGEKVPEEALSKILEAGRLAPTAKNGQEQKVYVLQSEEALRKYDGATPCRYGAGTVLLVAFDKTKAYVYQGGSKNTGPEDASIVATHMMLMAKEVGVDSCWINFFDPEKMRQALGLPENEEVVMALDLGYPAEGAKPLPNHASRKPLSETVVRL